MATTSKPAQDSGNGLTWNRHGKSTWCPERLQRAGEAPVRCRAPSASGRSAKRSGSKAERLPSDRKPLDEQAEGVGRRSAQEIDKNRPLPAVDRRAARVAQEPSGAGSAKLRLRWPLVDLSSRRPLDRV